MRFLQHVFRLVWEATTFSIASRRYAVIAVVAIGLLLVAVALTAKAVAPLALYPFA